MTNVVDSVIDWLRFYKVTTIFLLFSSERAARKATKDPEVAALRGNDAFNFNLTAPQQQEQVESSYASLWKDVEPREYHIFMKQYLASRFGVQTIPQGRDASDVNEMGRQFSPTRDVENEVNDTIEGLELDGDFKTASVPDISRHIRSALIKNSGNESRRSSFSVKFKLSDNTTTTPPVKTSSEGSKHQQSSETRYLSLVEVSNKLMPRQICDTTFFASCARTFISDAYVWDFLNEARVVSILKDCRPDDSQKDRNDLASNICGMPASNADIEFKSYRKVFAILILLEKADKILDFVEEQVHDNLLPLRCLGSPEEPTAICCPDDDSCHPCFRGWAEPTWRRFLSLQTKFCTPYFKQTNVRDNCYHYKFPEGVAIPFLSKGDGQHSSGAFADVKKVALPEEHGNVATYRGGSSRVFAVKKLRASNRHEFESEAYILARLNKIGTANGPPKHLTVLLATFEIGPDKNPTFYFLFPCADGNLKEFWNKSTDDPERMAKFSKWMAGQLHGLSTALEMLHDFKPHRTDSDRDSRNKGIHGDIKPQNILLFGKWDGCQEEIGMLQLADFGLTRYHHTQTVNQVAPIAGLHPYCPPESELQWNTGQSLDVWSLGCLFLEFSVWLVFGCKGRKDFQEARQSTAIQHPNMRKPMFYEIQETKGFLSNGKLKIKINSGVITWIDNIHKDVTSTEFLHNFIDFILREMLALEAEATNSPGLRLTKQSHDGFGGRRKERIKIKKLVSELEKFLAEKDPYFHEPSTYAKTGSIKTPQLRTTMTKNEVRKRADNQHLRAERKGPEISPQADASTSMNSDVRSDSFPIPPEGVVSDSVAVGQITEDAKKEPAGLRKE